MVKHFIIMSSSYTDGTRVALDITNTNLLNQHSISNIISHIRHICGNDLPFSTHMIEGEDDSWSSVTKYDPFFEDVLCTKSLEEFLEKIKKGRILTGLDVATYILSKVKCTHLSLEKLVYFAYADYLCEYGHQLFEDKIYAFAHGPVIASVYDTYKKSGYRYVSPPEHENERGIYTGVDELPARSRILFAKDGAEKLRSIDRTIHKYGTCSANFLVSLTHRNGTPWSQVDSSKSYQIISDQLIYEYHHIESI
ncbi:MAG: DUF4065 domain-containing protein [Firmicutes bacterium]|nr:DUF4065 domain-containing protein [Bacillota bacterium]